MGISLHYESDIIIVDDLIYGKVVQKKYKESCECVKWLNGYLDKYYPLKGIMPIAQHEASALQLLDKYGFVPKLIGVNEDSIFMEYSGESLELLENIDKSVFIEQAQNIHNIFNEIGFKHNDLLERNFLVKNGKLYVIDFTLSEFNGIEIMKDLPDKNWAYPQLNESIMNHFSKNETNLDKVKNIAQKIYNYHNLGVGLFPEGEEKTPYGSGERYNFDRMYMMVSNYDFTHKNILDIGCNSGWFCFQTKLLGSKLTVGLDYSDEGMMGQAILYAQELEKRLNLGVKFYDVNVEGVDFQKLIESNGESRFDVAIILSVLHHIKDKKALWNRLYNVTKDVIFYEDHEFWNDLFDENGNQISVKGEGHRFGWNEDLTWQRKIGSLEKYEKPIIDNYMKTWRRETLMMDYFKEIKFLGFSEKRRPMLAFIK